MRLQQRTQNVLDPKTFGANGPVAGWDGVLGVDNKVELSLSKINSNSNP